MLFIIMRIYTLISMVQWCVARIPESPNQYAIHTSNNSALYHDNHGYEIISEEVVYSRWRSILSRRIRHPKDGKIVEYDIVDQVGAGAVIVFAWNSVSKTATLVREYNPGNHKVMAGLAAGIVETDPDKHGSDFDVAARHELEEECHLSGGKWYRLLDDGATLAMDKYCTTGIAIYLVIDAIKVNNPRPLDDEEDIEILEGVPIDEIKKMINRGDFNLVGCCATLLAIEKLKELGEIQ